jgi:hypothetical protein
MMTVLLSTAGATLILFCLLMIFLRQRTVAKIDGCTIKFRGMREEATIYYCEPSGRTLTFDAYWSSPKNREVVLQVEFPVVLSVPEVGQPREQESIERLEIPEIPSVRTQLSSTQRDEIKGRVSRALTKLKITHTFVAPQQFGWTSFEHGKEIYHG